MKRLFTLLLVTVMFAAVCGCTVTGKIPASDTPFETVDGIDVFFPYASDKIALKEDFTESVYDRLEILMIKNEREGAQFILRCNDSDITDLAAYISDLTDEKGNVLKADIFREHYIDVSKSEVRPSDDYFMPDAIIPLFNDDNGNNSFTVNAGENQAFYISVRTRADTVPGEYTGQVRCTCGAGEIIIPVVVTVCDITLPEVSSCKTNMGNSWQSTDIIYKNTGYDCDVALYEYLLDNRLNGADIPGVVWPWDKGNGTGFMYSLQNYGLDPRVQSFTVAAFFSYPEGSDPYYTVNTKGLQQWNETVSSFGIKNGVPDLASKGYLYVMDEIGFGNTIEVAKQLCTQYNGTGTDFKHIITLNAFEKSMDGYLEYWCVNHNCKKSDIKRIRANGGKEVWWYGVEGFLIGETDTAAGKSMFWTQKDYDIEGFLNWAINHYGIYDSVNNKYLSWQRDVWTDAYFCIPSDTGYMSYGGDGYLIYPGRENDGIVNRNMFISSLRLEATIDGIEDYDLLTLREQQITDKLALYGITGFTANDLMQMYYEPFYNDVAKSSNVCCSEARKYDTVRRELIRDILSDSDILVSVTVPEDISECSSRTVAVIAPDAKNVFVNGIAAESLNGVFTARIYCGADETCVTVSADGEKYDFYLYPKRIRDTVTLCDFEADGQSLAESLGNGWTASDDGLTANFSVLKHGATISSSLFRNSFSNWSGHTYLAVTLTNSGDTDIDDIRISASGALVSQLLSKFSLAAGETKTVFCDYDLGSGVSTVTKVAVAASGGVVTFGQMYLCNVK